MDDKHVAEILDDESTASRWLRGLQVKNVERGFRNLNAISESGVTLDLMNSLCTQLELHLPRTSDPGNTLNNLERFVLASRSPLAFVALTERDPTALPILLQIIGTSQHLADLLVRDTEGYDHLRLTDGRPVARQYLIDDLVSETHALADEQKVMMALRRFKHRETLRIAYGDIVGQQRIAGITRQISYVADAVCEAALHYILRRLEDKYGVPQDHAGQPVGMVILALGKLGGNELNYSSDIDLVALYAEDGKTSGNVSRSNREFFERVVRDLVKLLSENTSIGIAYRVDLRLRPNGNQGPLINSLENTWQYYDVSGRTWERQAFVKARAIAGDLKLGQRFLKRMEPWIYRKYLSRADITGIKALKRRIEHRAHKEGVDERNVKTGHGGIRDIEFVIQFLQLLNGGDLPKIRTTNTLDAIDRLQQAGCLTMQERGILTDNYAFLRKVEHRLQIMFDLQTHTLPESDQELAKFAVRMGYADGDQDQALEEFKKELHERTTLNRRILDHLLHDAFNESEETDPEVDLILEPEPDDSQIESVLRQHGFRDVKGAYQNLNALAIEHIPFLSTRRCRHFLAAIAPHLLRAIAETPDPDATLVSLSQVSDSLGGKGVLWELFSYNPPSLQLYVTLCASSPYLASILTSNPGMADELMDSLMLDRLPSLTYLQEMLTELSRGAEDLDPILHSFKNSQHLRVGVRDILGKEDVRETHRALSDIAEVCLQTIAEDENRKLQEKFGTPISADGSPSELVILAMGKLGGREPNYHSDLDVVFLYTFAGTTKTKRADRSTSNQHFFSQLAAKITKRITQIGPYGRLYELDPRLRPSGKSGALAVSLEEFRKYFVDGMGQGWERQALCKSRPIFCSPAACALVQQAVRESILSQPWTPARAEEIRAMRTRIEANATVHNLKRGEGGTVDIEFIIQMLQLRFVADTPEVLVPGTLEALKQLHNHHLVSNSDFRFLNESYRFLRSIEARLRLMNTTARHDVPDSRDEMKKLAYLLGYPTPEQLSEDIRYYRSENREYFDRIFSQAANNAPVT